MLLVVFETTTAAMMITVMTMSAVLNDANELAFV